MVLNLPKMVKSMFASTQKQTNMSDIHTYMLGGSLLGPMGREGRECVRIWKTRPLQSARDAPKMGRAQERTTPNFNTKFT